MIYKFNCITPVNSLRSSLYLVKWTILKAHIAYDFSLLDKISRGTLLGFWRHQVMFIMV